MRKLILSTILLSILTGCGVGEKICSYKLENGELKELI